MPSVTLLVVAEAAWAEDLRNTLFAREGMRIVIAGSLAEAQQKARFAPPDIVIAHRQQPDGLADEFCRWLRHNLGMKSVRIVVMLSADRPDEALAAREAGADQVIVQPSSPQALTPLVAKIIEAPLRQEIRVPVEIRVEGEAASGTTQGLTRNVSLGGALLEIAPLEIRPKDSIYVRLHLTGASKPVVAKAECMRVTAHAMGLTLGVRFVRFEKDSKEILKKFLQTTV